MGMPVEGNGVIARRGGELHVGLWRVLGEVALENNNRMPIPVKVVGLLVGIALSRDHRQ